MTTEEITRAKFQACMRNTVSKYEPFELYTTKKLADFDFQEFNKIMIKADLDEYSKMLYDYFINVLDTNQLNREPFESFNMNSEEVLNHRFELLKTIRFLISNSKDHTKSFTISKTKNRHTLKDERLLFDIESFLINYFHQNFKIMYSADDADQQLKSEKYASWLEEWINKNSLKGIDHLRLYQTLEDDNNLKIENDSEILTAAEVKARIIKDFRMSHSKPVELDIEILDELILKHETQLKTKSGARLKNHALAIIGNELSDLIRLNDFIANMDYQSLEDITINNHHLRFIYSILDFWGMIPEKEENTSTPEKYLRTILKQTRNYLSQDSADLRVKRFAELKARYHSKK